MNVRKTRAIADGDLVCIHSRVQLERGGRRVAVVHISEGERIAELWTWASHSPSTCRTNTVCSETQRPHRAVATAATRSNIASRGRR